MYSIFFLSLILSSISWVTPSTITPGTSTPAPTPAPAPKIWALLTAGSNGWSNYRHQADICHAYHILRNHGIPDENIVVMMYDDIADNSHNPNPGVIINEPNGTDVYEGVIKDYTGKDVTAENFLNILQGKKELLVGIGSGKVIESGPDDVVFVNFVDHGSTQILGFPEGNEPLHAYELASALDSMTKENRFSKMFLFIEACESGSVFQNIISENTNIFVMTASDPYESSWACYCESGVCLGDLFSVNWMHQAEIEPLTKTSVHHLFQKVRAATTASHVEEYGDLDIGNMTNSKIIGVSEEVPNAKSRPFKDPNLSIAPQTDATLIGLQHTLENALKEGKLSKYRKMRKLLSNEIQRRQIHMKTMDNIIAKIAQGDTDKIEILKTTKLSLETDVSKCYKIVLKDYFANCLNFSENEFMYPSLKYFRVACNVKWTNAERIKHVIRSVCQNQ